MYYTTKQHQASITIRPARAQDAAALRQLAQRDSATLPDGDLLVGIAGEELRAAVSIQNGAAISDPFQRSGELVKLLSARAVQLRGAGGARGARSRLRRVFGGDRRSLAPQPAGTLRAFE